MSQDQICQKRHCSSVISSLNVNTRALQQLWCFYSNAVFPSVQWSTLVRTCQQRSWRCTILISSVTSETGEQILTRESRARVSKAVSGIKGEAATETRESCWGKIPTQPHWATEVTVWMCVCVCERNFKLQFLKGSQRRLFMFCDLFVSDSSDPALWKPDSKTSTVHQPVPRCCWRRCTPAIRYISSSLLFTYQETRPYLPDSVRMFWLWAAELQKHVLHFC